MNAIMINPPGGGSGLLNMGFTRSGIYLINGGFSATSGCDVWLVEAKPNTTYTVSGINAEGRFQIGTVSNIDGASNGKRANSWTATRTATGFTKNPYSLTITLGNDDHYIAIWNWWNGNVGGKTYEEVVGTMQIEEGSVATEKL